MGDVCYVQRMRRFRIWALAAAMGGLAACSSVPVRVHPGPPLSVQVLAVYPCEFRWDEPAYRSFEISEALTLQAVAAGRWSVFGPGEFKLVQASVDNPFVGSDIALQLADHGMSPTAALVIKPAVEKRVQSELKQVFDSRGNPKGMQRVEAASVVAKLQVFHSGSREVIAEALQSVEIDPLAPREPTDPLPEVTALFKRMMTEIVSALASRAPGEVVARDPGFEFVWNPKAALDFALEGRPTFADALSQLDALDQDVALEARLRFFLPDTETATLARLKRMPGGLWVTTVTGAAPSGLQAGDLIVKVNGETALPQVLYRALRAAPRRAVELQVRRSSALVDVALSVP